MTGNARITEAVRAEAYLQIRSTDHDRNRHDTDLDDCRAGVEDAVEWLDDAEWTWTR